MLNNMHPPEHTKLRAVLRDHFTPAKIAHLEPVIRDERRVAARARNLPPDERERPPRLADPFVEDGPGRATLVGAPAAVRDDEAEAGGIHRNRRPTGRLEGDVESVSGDRSEADGLVHRAALDGDSVLGLPKVRTKFKVRSRKSAKREEAEAAQAATEEGEETKTEE